MARQLYRQLIGSIDIWTEISFFKGLTLTLSLFKRRGHTLKAKLKTVRNNIFTTSLNVRKPQTTSSKENLITTQMAQKRLIKSSPAERERGF